MPPLPGDVQWFPAEIRRLIVAIKKQEGLYNPRHENFGMRDSQARAWKAVAALVGGGKTDAQCRDKWNCLRGTYRRHVRTEATNNVKRRSGWPWADMMCFIKPYVIERDDLPDSHLMQNGTKSPTNNAVMAQNTHTSSKVVTHSPLCPMTNVNKLTAVNISTANGTGGTGGLTFAGGLYSGGIIFNTNRVGIGIVQPNQANVGVGILQPNQANLSIVQPSQPKVAMGIVQPSQTHVGMGVVQPIQTNVGKTNVTQPDVRKSENPNAIHVDLSKVKRDPDDPKSPANTEFIDMDVAVKKEPMEEDELQLPEDFNFLPDESTQESTQEHEQTSEGSSGKSSGGAHEQANSGRNVQASPREADESCRDSNTLFMRSTVAHMRKLSPYDQSVFKLKVQQLLHDMMFPQQPATS